MNSGLGRHSTCKTAGLTSRQAKCRLLNCGEKLLQPPGPQTPHHSQCDSVTNGPDPCGQDQSQWTMDLDTRWILDPRAGPVQGWTWMRRAGSVQGRPSA